MIVRLTFILLIGRQQAEDLLLRKHSGNLRQCRQQISGLSIVAERFTHVDKAVNISRRKNKAAAQLKWIFAQAVLAHADGFCSFASASIVSAQQMKQVGFLKAHRFVSLALIINEKRKGDAGLLAEMAGITRIAQTHGCQARALLAKLLFKFAQLRNVLTAEDSTVMPEKDNHRGRITP